MSEQHSNASFREGWLPVSRSRSVALGFEQYLRDYHVEADCLYYFKPLARFLLPGLSDDERLEEIDARLVEAFRCDFDDVLTVHTEAFGPVIVMPERALRRSGTEPLPFA